MRIRLITLLCILMANIIAAQTTHHSHVLIEDISVVQPGDEQLIPHRYVYIADGTIRDISMKRPKSLPGDTKIISGKGKYLMPSLADMHVHLPEANKLDTLLLLNTAAGITRIRAMNTAMDMNEAKKYWSPSGITTPHIHTALLFHRTYNYTAAQADSFTTSSKALGYDFIKLFSVKNDTVFHYIMAAAKKQNAIVCGHFPSPMSLSQVLQSGFKSIEHLGGYTNISEPALQDAAALITARQGTFNCPTLDFFRMAYIAEPVAASRQRIGYEFAPVSYRYNWDTTMQGYLSRTSPETIQKDSIAYATAWEQQAAWLRRLQQSGAPLLIGSDPGLPYQLPGFNVYDEMLLFSKAGIPNSEILKAATYNAAKFFNEEKAWGSIAVGMNAELILLDANPLADLRNMSKIALLINGEEITDIPALRKALQAKK